MKRSKIIRSITKRWLGLKKISQILKNFKILPKQREVNVIDYLIRKFLGKLDIGKDIVRLVGKDLISESLLRNIAANDIPNFYAEIATHMMSFGLQNDAAVMFETSLKLRHDDGVAINYLQNLMCCSEKIYSQEKIYNITKNVMSKLAKVKTKSSHFNRLDANRIINIGYTSHFFDNTTGTTLFLPIIKNHDRNRVKIFIYSDQNPEQTKLQTMKSADVWRDTHKMSDEEFCEIVRSDKIDVMLELNGFCILNRYRALNMRPAPVQVSFYNLSATSGVSEIDYVLVGEEVKTNHLQKFYTEKFFHKKGIQLATEIGSHFPDVKNKIPFHQNGHITFGSFGQAHKVSREQIFLWAKVLQKVEGSKFFMKANALNGDGCVAAFKRHFSDAGIDLSRVIFEGGSDYDKLLKCYERVDVALDTYPYGAGTTTIEALIQGTPVISLVGNNFCSQHGLINLRNVGHEELICYSEAEFIKKAVDLANDPEEIERYRNVLRNDIASSERSNIKKYVKELEDAYLEMFSIYAERQKISK